MVTLVTSSPATPLSTTTAQRSALVNWPAMVEALNADRTELLRLIRAGDGTAAAELVERHIRHFPGALVGHCEDRSAVGTGPQVR